MIDLLRQRRSIRKFKKEKIAPELIETIVEAALRARHHGHQPLTGRERSLLHAEKTAEWIIRVSPEYFRY